MSLTLLKMGFEPLRRFFVYYNY